MTIEWKKLSASNGDSYIGYIRGLRIADIMEIAGEYHLMFYEQWHDHPDSGMLHFPTLEEAKAKAEQLFKEWKEAAGLVSLSEIYSCDKCGDSGRSKVCPKCDSGNIKELVVGGTDQCEDCMVVFTPTYTYDCDCLKDSHSLASINRATQQGASD
jgi:hypothetical protein